MEFGNTMIIRDGIPIALPLAHEMPLFEAWARKNKINDPLHEAHHYDNVGAWRAGINRSENGHFPDTFKLPGHETFSVESMYYRPGMPAGKWEGETYIPIDRGF